MNKLGKSEYPLLRDYKDVTEDEGAGITVPEPMAHFGLDDRQKVDEIKVVWPDQEVSILKDLDHPNITRYYTSFANG